MYLIVGLGNPGEEYENNRHNVGFKIADAIKLQITNSKLQTNYKIEILKPKIFMNDSGEEVKKAVGYYKIEPQNIFVVHDDLDLEFGTVRVSFASSSGGHNGVQSIIEHLRTQNFWRVRVGIGRPPKNIPSEKFVLQDFNRKEKNKIDKIIDQTAKHVLNLISRPKEETIKLI